jgi:ATP-dependent exoDNAse (exonuclease V) alpha subunit
VLVVDEAAMVDTRTIARLAARTEQAGGMLVLCGDDHQITEIGAGGAFSGLARRLGATTLTGNRRQRSEHERLKERLLRLAVPEAYLRTATDAGELVFCAGVQDARELLVAEWLREHTSHGPGESIMIARAREDVEWLNEVARSVLRRTSDGPGRRSRSPVGTSPWATG